MHPAPLGVHTWRDIVVMDVAAHKGLDEHCPDESGERHSEDEHIERQPSDEIFPEACPQECDPVLRFVEDDGENGESGGILEQREEDLQRGEIPDREYLGRGLVPDRSVLFRSCAPWSCSRLYGSRPARDLPGGVAI